MAPPRLTDEQRAISLEKYKARKKITQPKYFTRKIPSKLLWASRKRAKERCIEHTITEEDIKVPDVCPYLGVSLVEHVPRGQPRIQCASLDRIDNSKGYIPGNVEVISHLANTMKNCATKEQLISFAKYILEKYDSGV